MKRLQNRGEATDIMSMGKTKATYCQSAQMCRIQVFEGLGWKTSVKVLITREAAHIYVVAYMTLASDDEKIPLINILSHSIS